MWFLIKRRKCISCIVSLLIFTSLVQSSYLDKRVNNPKGWNLPDINRLIYEKTEKREIAGINEKVIIEYYYHKDRYNEQSDYYIYNPPVKRDHSIWLGLSMKQQVGGFIIYMTTKREKICYRYWYINRGLTEESKNEIRKMPQDDIPITVYGGSSVFLSDLDNNSIIESLWYDPVTGTDNKPEDDLIAFIYNIKFPNH